MAGRDQHAHPAYPQYLVDAVLAGKGGTRGTELRVTARERVGIGMQDRLDAHGAIHDERGRRHGVPPPRPVHAPQAHWNSRSRLRRTCLDIVVSAVSYTSSLGCVSRQERTGSIEHWVVTDPWRSCVEGFLRHLPVIPARARMRTQAQLSTLFILRNDSPRKRLFSVRFSLMFVLGVSKLTSA
jgi:hypothetical protein